MKGRAVTIKWIEKDEKKGWHQGVDETITMDQVLAKFEWDGKDPIPNENELRKLGTYICYWSSNNYVCWAKFAI